MQLTAAINVDHQTTVYRFFAAKQWIFVIFAELNADALRKRTRYRLFSRVAEIGHSLTCLCGHLQCRYTRCAHSASHWTDRAAQHDGRAVKRKALSWRLMSPYWTVQLPTRSAIPLTFAGRPACRPVFSYRALQATLHVRHDGRRLRLDDDDAKRRSFISWNGARLFDDTLAALSRPELGDDGKTLRRLSAPRGKESACGRVASSRLNKRLGCRSRRKRASLRLYTENVHIYNSHKQSPKQHLTQ